MNVGDIPGWIALVLSLSVIIRNIYTSRIPLKMKFRSADVVWYENNCSIVIFHLDFVNRSSKVQTLFDIQLTTPLLISHKNYPFKINENGKSATCILPTGEEIKTSIVELLRPPLDLTRGHPLSKVFASYLQIPEPTDLGDVLPLQFHFFVLDPDDKQVASDSVIVRLRQLRTIGSYTRQYSAKLKPKNKIR